MIAFLKGTVADRTEGSVVLDVGGVGYEVLVPGQLLDRIGGLGQEIKLHTYMQLRDDAVSLFGFAAKDDLRMFRLLIGVSGVGPKAALGILSALGTDELRLAVLADDAKRIAKTPGVGAKTAQKIILELKDKLDLQETLEHTFGSAGDPLPAGAGPTAAAAQDAVEALVALGYGSTEALRAVRSVEQIPDMDAETLLREALKHLF